MLPALFDYHAPASLDDACRLLQTLGPGTQLLAGGLGLVSAMRRRQITPRAIIDLRQVSGLASIQLNGSTVEIGAMTTQTEIETSRLLSVAVPMLGQVAHGVGDPMVKARATLGGALAEGASYSDWAAPMLVLEADIVVRRSDGSEWRIPADMFFRGSGKTALESGDILTRIEIPHQTDGTRHAYRKLRHPASGSAALGIAVAATVRSDGVCSDCLIAITGATERPRRAPMAEEALMGRVPTEYIIRRAAEQVVLDLALEAADEATAYRSHIARVYVARVLSTLLA